MNIRILLLICMLCTLDQYALSQQIESNSNRQKIYAFEVKHIDEFFERFNNDSNAYITGYVKTNYPGIAVDRKSLITNLYNRQKNDWNTNEVNRFLSEVTDSVKPVYLDFDNKEWYAEALSRFEYNGKFIDVVIILRIQQESNGGSKWMIVSAYSRLIESVKQPMKSWSENNSKKFLNPMSHATNFISLSAALTDKLNIYDYLDNVFLQSSSSRAFLHALLMGKLKYLYVKKIKYHFLQVDGWLFTADRFQRQSVNSGWLISNLLKASDNDKETYKRMLFKTDR